MLQQEKENNRPLMDLIRSGSILNIELAFQIAKSQNITLDLSNYTKLYLWLDYFVQGTNINCPEAMLKELSELEVLNLSLSQQKKIPTSIGLLSNLRVLLLSLNNLSSLPKTIKQLSQLESLDLSHNKLKRLPKEIQNLQRLKILKLGNNQLIKIPPSIFNMNTIEHLALEQNQITRLPNSIGQLDQLKTLNLNDNPLLDLPQSLESLRKLEKLVLPLHLFQKATCAKLSEKLPYCTISFGNASKSVYKQD